MQIFAEISTFSKLYELDRRLGHVVNAHRDMCSSNAALCRDGMKNIAFQQPSLIPSTIFGAKTEKHGITSLLHESFRN